MTKITTITKRSEFRTGSKGIPTPSNSQCWILGSAKPQAECQVDYWDILAYEKDRAIRGMLACG